MPNKFLFLLTCALVPLSQSCSTAEENSSLTMSESQEDPLGLAAKKKKVSTQVIKTSVTANDQIKIGSHTSMAGAISSLVWNEKEFINNYDHGRQYQVAWIADGDDLGPCGECRNPTEAGGRYDKEWTNPSSSKLLGMRNSGNILETSSYPAYWMKPGELWKKDQPFPARNTTVVSDYLLTKRVEVGFAGIKNAIQFEIAIKSPRAHQALQIEAPTAYLNAEFTEIYTYDYDSNTLTNIGQQYQDRQDIKSILIATADGKYAMGAWAPEQGNGFVAHYAAGYFSGSGKNNSTAKWTIPMRARNIPAGDIKLKSYQFVGTLEDVKVSMAQVVKLISGKQAPILNSTTNPSAPAGQVGQSPTVVKTPSVSPVNSSGTKYSKGLFKVGAGIYYSNGTNAFCGFTTPQHLKRCGHTGKPISNKPSLPSGMRNDGACGC